MFEMVSFSVSHSSICVIKLSCWFLLCKAWLSFMAQLLIHRRESPGGRGAVQPMCASRKKSIFQQCSILKRYSWPLVFLTSVKWSGVLAWTLSLAFIKRHLSLELTNSNSGSWEMVFLSHLSRCSIFTHSGFLRRNKFWSIIIHIINYDVNVGVWLPVGKAAWNDKGTSLSPSAGWTPHTLCPFCASHMVTNFQLHHNFNLSSEIFS